MTLVRSHGGWPVTKEYAAEERVIARAAAVGIREGRWYVRLWRWLTAK